MYSLIEVKPSIFLMKFESAYDLAMHFLRYQEYYESPNEQFRDKAFTIIDFMEWYAKDNGRACFTYPKDWSGYNLPQNVIREVLDLGIPDYNKYDDEMQTLYRQIIKTHPKFYLIGACNDDDDTIQHEIAHGLFYTDIQYKKQMTALVKALDQKKRAGIFKHLGNMGYAEHVYVDECQAYLSTGVCWTGNWKRIQKPFIKVFEEFNAR